MTIHYDHDAAYQPGVCNIGPQEIARRRRAGWLGVATAAVLAVALVVAGSDPILRILVAAPLGVGFASLLQARRRFCVNYGLRGLAGFGSSWRETERIEDREARAADRAAAIRIAGQGATAAMAIALLLVVLPI